jgi:hypothetical protein
MSTYVNLNIIWVISLLLLVIIILSGIKICRNPIESKTLATQNTNPIFVDKTYKYISEPFYDNTEPPLESADVETPAPSDYPSIISELANRKFKTTLDQTIQSEKQNSQINLLSRQIDSLENKISVLQQLW